MVNSQLLRANSWVKVTLQNETSFLPFRNYPTHVKNIPQLPFTSPMYHNHPVFCCSLKALAFSVMSRARLSTNETLEILKYLFDWPLQLCTSLLAGTYLWTSGSDSPTGGQLSVLQYPQKNFTLLSCIPNNLLIRVTHMNFNGWPSLNIWGEDNRVLELATLDK